MARRRLRALAALAWTSALAGPAAADPYLAAEPNDVVLSPLIQQTADELGNDPVRIYEFVRNELRYESYYGLMKGPEGTLHSRAGNDYDLAALLVSLYRASGIPARFVRGRIEVDAQQAMSWTGATSAQGALNLWTGASPFDWQGVAGVRVEAHPTFAVLWLMHVWVEALVPMARYRGSGPDPEQRGKAWIPLDPSYKLSDWSPSAPLPIGTVPALTFDYTGANGYYRSVHPELPAEIFEDQVRTYLAQNQPGAAVADVALRQTIRREAPGVLPNALPYKAIAGPGGTVPQRSASLMPLHTCTPNGAGGCVLGPASLSPHPKAGAQGASDFHWKWTLNVCRDPYRYCEPENVIINGVQYRTACSELINPDLGSPPPTGIFTPGDGKYHYTFSIPSNLPPPEACVDSPSQLQVVIPFAGWSSELDGRRVSLVFPPIPQDVPDVPPEGYSDCPFGGFTIKVKPELRVGGQVRPISPTLEVPVCDPLDIVLGTWPPLAHAPTGTPLRSPLSIHDVRAGGTYVAGLDAFGASPPRTRSAAEALIAAQTTFPLERVNPSDPNSLTYVDQDHDRIFDPNEQYFGRHFQAQEALTGGLLHLASQRYFEISREGERKIDALHHLFTLPVPRFGLISSGLQVDYLFGVPFSARASNLLVDIQGALKIQRNRQGLPLPSGDHAFVLFGHHMSAGEHAVWEELAQVEAVSTVKGLQLQLGMSNIDVFSIDEPNEIDDAFDSCSDQNNTCTEIDPYTYCELRKGAKAYESAGKTNAWRDEWCPGADWDNCTEELRIAKRSAFAYDTWQGYVYYKRWRIDPDDPSDPNDPVCYGGQAFGIVPIDLGAAGGGYMIDEDFSTITQLIGTGQPLLAYDPDPTGVASSGEIVVNDSQIESQYGRDADFLLNLIANLRVLSSDPVAVVNGNLFLTTTDLQIRGRGGHDLRLVRSYNSRLDYAGPLGHGWIHTYDQHLQVDAGDPNDPADDSMIWRDELGGETRFADPSPGQPGELPSPPWSHHTLRREPAGAGYTLTTKHGTIYRFITQNAQGKARLESITDRNGNQIACQYEGDGDLWKVLYGAEPKLIFQHGVASHRLNRVIDTSSRQWNYKYNTTTGDLIEYRDPVEGPTGRPWVYEYHSGLVDPKLKHNLRRWIRPADRHAPAGGDVWMEFSYFDDDTVYQHTSSIGETTRFAYDVFRRRTEVIHPDGAREVYFFDNEGNVTRHESGRGVVRDYEFAPDRRDRVGETDGLGFQTTAEYDSNGNMTRRVDRLGNVEEWSYGGFGQVVRHVEPHAPSDPNPIEQRFEYDAKGNLLREFAEIGGQLRLLRRHAYDGFGNRIETIEYMDSTGATRRTRLTYDATGTALVRVIDALGNSIRYTLDGLARPIRAETLRTDPDRGFQESIVVQTDYDLLDRPIRTTDPAGTKFEVDYDANGLITQRRTIPAAAIGGLPPVRVDEINAYDDFDRRIQTTNALGETTLFQYDAEGRVVRSWQELDLDSRVLRPFELASADQRLLSEVLLYDARGNPVQMKDGAGHTYAFDYDDLGRKTKATGPVGLPEAGETTFQYDLVGRLVSRTEKQTATKLRTIEVRYDFLDRVVEITDPLGRRTSFAYDEVGNRIESTNGAGERVQYRYDKRGLLVRRMGPGLDDEFGYDPLGRQTLARNAGAARSFQYDALDRVISAYDAQFGTARRVYDKDGRVAQVVYPDGAQGFSEGIGVSYDYDARGQLTTIADPRAGRWHFQYDALGRLLQRTHSSGERRSLAYTPEGFVERIEVAYPAGGADVFTYADHDVLGNPPTLTTQTRGLPSETTTVSYDARSRVASVTYRPGGPNQKVEQFQYDLVGNRTKRSLTEGGGTTHRNYTVDVADQITEIKTLGAVVESFGYDGAGRRINDTVLGPGGIVLTATSYGYDPLGRVVSVARSDSGVPSYSATLEYDALGTRTRRTENGSQTGLYFGEWAEVHGPVPQDKLRLVHGGGIDEILAEVAGPTTNPQIRRLVADAGANVLRVDAGADREPLTLLNASFEHDLDQNQTPDGWTFDPIQSAHGTVSLDSTRAYSAGGRSVKLDVPNVLADPNNPTGTSTDNLKARQSVAAPSKLVAPASDSYVISACFYVESGGPLQLRLKNLNTGAKQDLHSPTGPPGWTCSVSPTSTAVPASAGHNFEVTARITEPGSGRVWVDNVRILNDPPPSGSSTFDPSTLESQRRFEAFGALRTGSPQPPPIPSERSFASRQTEGATGLVYMRARHYDPATGRFLQPDPLGLDTDQLYAYARSNPYRFWDPSGMRPPPISAESAGGVSPLFWARALSGAGGLGEGAVLDPFDPLSRVQVNAQGAAALASPTLMGGVLGGAMLLPRVFAWAIANPQTVIRTTQQAVEFMSPLPVAGYGVMAAARGAAVPERLFHYTTTDAAGAIAKEGLIPGRSGRVFLTPEGGLSPLQAHIDLALPPNGAANALFEVDVGAMRRLGIDVPAPTPVGRSYNMPGGGLEVPIDRAIPPEVLRRLR